MFGLTTRCVLLVGCLATAATAMVPMTDAPRLCDVEFEQLRGGWVDNCQTHHINSVPVCTGMSTSCGWPPCNTTTCRSECRPSGTSFEGNGLTQDNGNYGSTNCGNVATPGVPVLNLTYQVRECTGVVSCTCGGNLVSTNFCNSLIAALSTTPKESRSSDFSTRKDL